MAIRQFGLSKLRWTTSRVRASTLSLNFVCQHSGRTSIVSAIPLRRRSFALFGLCCTLGVPRGFATVSRNDGAIAPSLLTRELSLLHVHFGGDSSVYDNQPMRQVAPSGGTISALSVQIPALEKLAPYISAPKVEILDLGFGSGVMVAMMLAVAGEGAKVVGVDLDDKIDVATRNLLTKSRESDLGPFPEQSFSLLGGDAFEYMKAWKEERRLFDVVYSGCSMDPATDQLRLFLGSLKPNGAAVFNLGRPGRQAMYFVAERGKVCELLMHVNFMMAESSVTPSNIEQEVPLDPKKLGSWIRMNIFMEDPEL